MTLPSTLIFIVLYGVSYGLVLFTISIGLVVTMGLMRVLNMAHGVFAALGGYITLTLMNQFSANIALAVLVAACVVAILSLPIERLFFVRLYKAPELDQVLLTVGLAFIGIASLNFFFGPDPLPSRLPPDAYRISAASPNAIATMMISGIPRRTRSQGEVNPIIGLFLSQAAAAELVTQ